MKGDVHLSLTKETRENLDKIAQRWGTNATAISKQILEATRNIQPDDLYEVLANLQRSGPFFKAKPNQR